MGDWIGFIPKNSILGTAYWWSPDSRSIAYLQFDVSGEAALSSFSGSSSRSRSV